MMLLFFIEYDCVSFIEVQMRSSCKCMNIYWERFFCKILKASVLHLIKDITMRLCMHEGKALRLYYPCGSNLKGLGR